MGDCFNPDKQNGFFQRYVMPCRARAQIETLRCEDKEKERSLRMRIGHPSLSSILGIHKKLETFEKINALRKNCMY